MSLNQSTSEAVTINNNPFSIGGRIGRRKYVVNVLKLCGTLALSTCVVAFMIGAVGRYQGIASEELRRLARAFGYGLGMVTWLFLMVNNLKRVRDSHKSKYAEWLYVLPIILIPYVGLVLPLILMFFPSVESFPEKA